MPRRTFRLAFGASRAPVAVGLTATLAVASLALEAHADKLWTDPPAKRAAVAIPSVAPLVDKYEPAVLVIFTEVPFTAEGLPPGHPPVGGPEGMPFPFPMPDDEDGPDMRGQGAGFLITPNGYALTNEHVVENAKSITVRVGDGKEEITAKVVGMDEKTDLALIKLDSPRTDWPVIPLGDSDALKVGDFVVAIGSPFGLEQSVSLGIISGRSRRDIAPSGRDGLYDFLQTDAGINPGNSGGPLINLYGEVIGINAAVNAAANNIGFAIPINMVKRILPSLKERGRFARSWIGVQITAVQKEHVKGLGLESARGALVRQVVDEGPGAKAGLLPGDVILSFEGKPISDSYELPLLAGEAGVGKSAKLDVIRDGKPKVLTLVLGEHPDNAPPEKKPDVAAKESPKDGELGLKVVTLDADDRERLKLRSDVAGTRISGVRPGSAAFLAGLQQDDVVLEVNKKETRKADDFATVVKAAPAGSLLRLLIRRGTVTLFVPLNKP